MSVVWRVSESLLEESGWCLWCGEYLRAYQKNLADVCGVESIWEPTRRIWLMPVVWRLSESLPKESGWCLWCGEYLKILPVESGWYLWCGEYLRAWWWACRAPSAPCPPAASVSLRQSTPQSDRKRQIKCVTETTFKNFRVPKGQCHGMDIFSEGLNILVSISSAYAESTYQIS